MSYLDVPRLHYSGTFIANPSTVNNTPTNYDPANASDAAPAWNPSGNGAWQFTNCTVKTAITYDGTVWNKAKPEAIIGASFATTNQPVSAKLVDLDTEQQMVSQIWGMQIKVSVPSTGDYFVGNFRPISFTDLWNRVHDGQQDWRFSAYYQSVLDNVSWSPRLVSPFLRQLQRYSPYQLSIKFVVDNYQDIYYQPDFNEGRVVGTIGPASPDEPANFVLGRQLRPVKFNATPGPSFSGTPLYFGYARVDAKRGKLLVDLGNSIPTQSDTSTKPPSQLPSAPPKDVGELSVGIIPPPQQALAPIMLGKFDYSLDAYCATAGVREYPLTESQVRQLTNAPFWTLGVFQTKPPGGGSGSGGKGSPKGNPKGTPTELVPRLQESPTGAYINATQPADVKNAGATSPVFRMAPGDKATVELVALQYGQPAANQSIDILFNNGMLKIQEPPPTSPPAPIPPDYTVGVPTDALTFPKSVTTDARGRARFDLVAGDPKNPRTVIDGQVYGVGYKWSLDDQPGFPSSPNSFLSVLVFDNFKKPPTWENIQPFMLQYAWLYPFMDTIFMLSDPEVIRQNIASFRRYLSFPYTDPRHMPVTRDLSPDKRQAIIAWLDAGAPSDPPPRKC